MSTVTWLRDGLVQEGIEYALAGTPCSEALRRGDYYCHGGAADLFPRWQFLRIEGIESYAAVALVDSHGERIGVLAAMTRGAFDDPKLVEALLYPSASRVALGLTAQRRQFFLRESNHRIKNSLQILSSLLSLQADATSHAPARCALEDAQLRVSTIAILHAQLCDSMEGAEVNLRPFLRSITENLHRTLLPAPARVSLHLAIDEVMLSVEQATACGLVVNELVTNSCRHAFGAGGHGHLAIYARQDVGTVVITVCDNGPGLTATRLESLRRGLGINLVETLAVEQLGGTLQFTGPPGAQAEVRFPLSDRLIAPDGAMSVGNTPSAGGPH